MGCFAPQRFRIITYLLTPFREVVKRNWPAERVVGRHRPLEYQQFNQVNARTAKVTHSCPPRYSGKGRPAKTRGQLSGVPSEEQRQPNNRFQIKLLFLHDCVESCRVDSR